MDYDKLEESIRKKLETELGEFVGQQVGSTIKEQMALSIAEIGANLEANMCGMKVVSAKSGWESMSAKEKIVWYICNKVFPDIAQKANELQYNARNAFNEVLDEHDDEEFYNVKLPMIFEYSPKSIIVVEAEIETKQPMEFMGLSILLDDSLDKPK